MTDNPEIPAIKATILAGGEHRIPLDPAIPAEALGAILEELANDLNIPDLHAEMGINDLIIRRIPPETPEETPEERKINLHDAILELRSRATQPVRLICIPRELSLRLVGERCEKLKTTIPMPYLKALHSQQAKMQLLVVDGTPVLALPMVAPMITLYYGTNDGTTLSAVEEHPAYPALPFSCRIADTEPNRLSNFAANALSAAIEASKQASDMWVPAIPFMPVAPPAPTPSEDDPPPAPKTDEEFMADVQSGLLRHKDDINEVIRADSSYQIKLGRASRMATQVKELLEDTLNVLVTMTPPDEQDFTIFTLTQRLLVS